MVPPDPAAHIPTPPPTRPPSRALKPTPPLPQFLFLMKNVHAWRDASRYERFKDGAKRGRLGRARKQYLKTFKKKRFQASSRGEGGSS